ncbi:50S ribosomal protein L22 [Candidatus Sumerlaeota bacterium]|nr:50S ribosomal protein L22 [Candidatus Sumerlaeota bacterium]
MPKFEENQVVSRASARFQRVSARKARTLGDRIRGKTVAEAMNILRFTHRPSADSIMENLLKSAVANVDRSQYPDTDELVIGELQVNGGPIMYRILPAPQGRAYRIRKRFCHISMKLVEA